MHLLMPLLCTGTWATHQDVLTIIEYIAHKQRFVRLDLVVLDASAEQRKLILHGLPNKQQGSVAKVVEEGAPPPMNVAQAAKTGATLTMWGGVAVLVSVCGFFVIKELWPSQMSPNSCFSAAFDFVKGHPEITSRLGPGLRAYGRDTHRGKEGRPTRSQTS